MARLQRLLRAAVSPPVVSRSAAVAAMERLSALTHLVSSLEYLVSEPDREPGGLNDWQVARDLYTTWPAPLRRALDVVSGRPATRAVHAARVAAAATLLAPTPRWARIGANALLTSTSLALNPRNHYGTDGSDQVAFVVQATCTVARALEDRPRAVDACLWFVGMQSVLSYATSGWVKVASPTWRSGRALPGIMRTRSYGEQHAWQLLRTYPRSASAASKAVLALECAFPLAHVGRGRPAPFFVAAAGSFHLANAGVMGLGRFLTSFCSMHPAVLYVTGPRERVLPGGAVERRSDLVPALAGGMVAAVLAAGAVSGVRQRRIVRRGRGDEQTMTTSRGNLLAYRWTRPAQGAPTDPTAPLLVFDTALGEVPEQAEWMIRELARSGPVITYTRHGYGRSRPGGRAGSGRRTSGLDASADDLADLVAHVAGERPAVLVGYSLGGYLAAEAALRLPGRILALALLDPVHPDEILNPDQTQDPDGRVVSDTLAQIGASLWLGLGALLQRPPWLDELPSEVRELALAHYHDPRRWSAARREWRQALTSFRQQGKTLPPIQVPTLLITSTRGTSLQQRPGPPRQLEYARSAAGAVHQQLDVHREQLVAHRGTTQQVGKLLAEFISTISAVGHAGRTGHGHGPEPEAVPRASA